MKRKKISSHGTGFVKGGEMSAAYIRGVYDGVLVKGAVSLRRS